MVSLFTVALNDAVKVVKQWIVLIHYFHHLQ
jgi:hypothetical protein